HIVFDTHQRRKKRLLATAITVDKRRQLLAFCGINMWAKITLNVHQNVGVIARVGGMRKQNNYALAVLVVIVTQILPLVNISHKRAKFAVFRLGMSQKDEFIAAVIIEKR